MFVWAQDPLARHLPTPPKPTTNTSFGFDSNTRSLTRYALGGTWTSTPLNDVSSLSQHPAASGTGRCAIDGWRGRPHTQRYN
ncbi:hypothetical protein RSAG8_01430, partial [Rhizoctonia solani AG-8 WAC10335]